MKKTLNVLSIIVERYYPDAFVFAILMSILALVMAFLLTDSSGTEIVIAWGDGLPAHARFKMPHIDNS